jgi:hypothetical protein
MSEQKFFRLDARLVGLTQLWGIVGAGSLHTFERIVEMAGDEHREGHPLLFTHKNIHYMVPVEELTEYFKEHPLPEKIPTTKDEEINSLKKKLDALEKQLELQRVGVSEAPKSGQSDADKKPMSEKAADIASIVSKSSDGISSDGDPLNQEDL